ncbi:MAG: asparagine synthase-related protein, partial [Thermoanaerobaculia bacterium]
ERGKKILAGAPRPPLPDEVRNRRKTGFTLPLKEWLKQESGGKVEFGKRTWARKVYESMFSSANGYY